MNLESLQELITQGEGPALEFKKSTGELRPAMESLCGMLNLQGEGKVLFGVTPKGEARGQMVADKTLEEIANATRHIEPQADFVTTKVSLGKGLWVVVIEAKKGKARGPFTFDRRPYLRVSNTTQKMAHSEFDERVVDRLHADKPWDTWVSPDWKVSDLDAEEIHQMVEDAIQKKRLSATMSGEKTETILRRLKLVSDDGITRAAAIVFGKEEGPGYPMGSIRLARFRGITKQEFRDNRQFEGNAFALLKHADKFLDDYIPIASKIVEGQMQRIDTPRYPPLALREAIVNALIHRDYSIAGGAVSIAVYDDRLEVWSSGTLPPKMTLAKLKKEHDSEPRNPLIASVFHRRGLIEQWGRGTNEILRFAREADCPEPEFLELGNSFVVRFWPVKIAGEEKAPETLEQKILVILRRSGPLSVSDVLKELGESVPLRSLQRELKQLVIKRKLAVSGKGKATTYRITDK